MAAVALLPGAVEDVYRLDEFLRSKNEASANSVSLLLDAAVARLERFPKLGKPLGDHAPFRELTVPFGGGAYVVRYRSSGSDVVVVRVWHSRERRE